MRIRPIRIKRRDEEKINRREPFTNSVVSKKAPAESSSIPSGILRIIPNPMPKINAAVRMGSGCFI
jgi:hypothetical protein